MAACLAISAVCRWGAIITPTCYACDDKPCPDRDFLACWYSDIGAVNPILIIRKAGDAGATLEARFAALNAANPFGISEYIVAMAMDTYVSFDFIAPLRPGEFGPCYEVRSYVLRPDGLATTIELWRKAVPGRLTVSPLLASIVPVSTTDTTTSPLVTTVVFCSAFVASAATAA